MNTSVKTPAFIKHGDELIAVNLYDTLKLEKVNERKILIRKEKGYKIPTNASNPVYRAATALRRLKPGKSGVKIRIEKNIPTFSGLHSQLSNAAGTLIALNRLWKTGLTDKKLLQVARSVDPRLAGIISQLLKPVRRPGHGILIRPKHIVIDPAWAEKHDSLSFFPDLKAVIRLFEKQGAEKSGLSGNGSVVFGWFSALPDIRIIKNRLKGKTDFFWTGGTCIKGAELIN